MPGTEAAALAVPLAALMRRAGETALICSGRPLNPRLKNGHSPVCDADIEVNDFLHAELPKLRPDAAWLSEETEDNTGRLSADVLWVVDPIDGTRSLLSGRADWTISVALVENGRPILAALYAPVTDELFMAAAGGITTLNGALVKASYGDGLIGVRIAGPQSTLNRLVELSPKILPQPKVHSLALRFARVAQGEIDASFASRNSHDWDLAAADLLVHQAGGALTDFLGQPLRYNKPNPVHGSLIAAGRARHEALVGLVGERRNEFA